MTNANLYDRLLGQGVDPARTAIETADGARWSYGDIAAASARLANLLVARGVKPGDRVAVQVEKSVENLLLYLATVRAGAVYLPLNTAYTLNELGYFLGDAEPTLIVCDPARRDGVAALAGDTPVETLDADGKGSLSAAAASQPPDFATVARAADDLAAILYTSGTTGRSKGAMLTHANLVSNAETLVDAWRFTSDDVLIHALPVYHTHGLFVAVNVALIARASMLFLPRFDADDVLRLMPRATAMMGVPTFYVRLLKHPGLTREATQQHAPVHLGLGAAARRDPPRMAGGHRPRHPRALRHDRDQHEHIEPL